MVKCFLRNKRMVLTRGHYPESVTISSDYRGFGLFGTGASCLWWISHGEQHPVWNDDGSGMSDVREGKIHQDLPRIHPYLDSLKWIWDILYKSGSGVDPMKEGWSVLSDGGSSSHG